MLLGLMRLGRLLGGLLLVTVLLAGCTDDEPDPDPSPSPSPSDSASSPTASPSAEPESAEEFIERWVQAGTVMQNTGETEEYLALSKGCAPCRRLARLVTRFYEAGGFIETDGWAVKGISEVDAGTRRDVFRLDVLSRPTKYQQSSSGSVKRLPGERTTYQVTLVMVGDQWRTNDFVEVAR